MVKSRQAGFDIGRTGEQSLPTIEVSPLEGGAEHDGYRGPGATEKPMIWWVSNDQAEVLRAMVKSKQIELPAYIDRELEIRANHDGRGRLWISGEFSLTSVPWDKSKETAELILRESSGGIVIRAEDFKSVLGLPGFVTDCELNMKRFGSGE